MNIIACVIITFALLFGLSVLILRTRDRFAEALWRRNPPGKLAADRLTLERRVLNPDWSFYEHDLQRPAPQALRDLYSDQSLVTAQRLDYGESSISSFEPLDAQAYAVPSDNCVGLNHHQGGFPVAPHSSQPDPEDSVGWRQLQPFGSRQA
jgi:hypothetical protein